MARRPANNPGARENQLIDLAVDLAEKQLREGTASAMVVHHFLKMASPREQLERQRLETENDHLRAKIEGLQSFQKIEERYENAIKAFGIYRGEVPDDL